MNKNTVKRFAKSFQFLWSVRLNVTRFVKSWLQIRFNKSCYKVFPWLVSSPVHTLIILLFFLSGCATKQSPKEEIEEKTDPALVVLTAEQFKNSGIEIGSFSKTTMAEEIKTNGQVDVPPQEMASVSMPVNGYIKTTSMLPGMAIRKGGILAVMNSMEIIQWQQDYLQTVAHIKFLEQDLDRQTVLDAENVGAKKKLQQVEAELASAKAQVKALEVKLQMIGLQIDAVKKGMISPTVNIVSPIDGFIQKVNISIGKNVNPTDVLFQITGNQHKHLELKVFANDVSKLKEGQIIEVENPKINGQTIRAKVFLIGKMLEGDERTVNIHGHCLSEAQEAKLIVGQYVNAKILTGTRIARTLPESAIVRKGQDGFIFLVEKQNSFRKISVKLGKQEGDKIEILSNELSDNQKIATKGVSTLEGVLNGGEEE
jgi:membrane fusion protein, heavy metal efflux system